MGWLVRTVAYASTLSLVMACTAIADLQEPDPKKTHNATSPTSTPPDEASSSSSGTSGASSSGGASSTSSSSSSSGGTSTSSTSSTSSSGGGTDAGTAPKDAAPDTTTAPTCGGKTPNGGQCNDESGQSCCNNHCAQDHTCKDSCKALGGVGCNPGNDNDCCLGTYCSISQCIKCIEPGQSPAVTGVALSCCSGAINFGNFGKCQ